METIKAIITTLDNLTILKKQVAILVDDPFIEEIIVVNNGSRDGTEDWLRSHGDLVTVINREPSGASAGRNAGLDQAGKCDYFLLLDGGVLPLLHSAERFLEFLHRRPDVHVIGISHEAMVTESSRAEIAWLNSITDEETARNTYLSLSAYCLARAVAFESIRFCEEGPFAERGWGVEDNEIAFQWNEAGIVVHMTSAASPYRRASGSFSRLFDETGIWPNQYGSVYEKRLVWTQHKWPQYLGGEPRLTLIVRVGDTFSTASVIKYAHDKLREKGLIAYSIVAWCERGHTFLEWALPRHLRQHHGDTIIVDGVIIRRRIELESSWTGDFRLWHGCCARDAVRPRSSYFGVVESVPDVNRLLRAFEATEAEKSTSDGCVELRL